jgi:hypothetical protein
MTRRERLVAALRDAYATKKQILAERDATPAATKRERIALCTQWESRVTEASSVIRQAWDDVRAAMATAGVSCHLTGYEYGETRQEREAAAKRYEIEQMMCFLGVRAL